MSKQKIGRSILQQKLKLTWESGVLSSKQVAIRVMLRGKYLK